jgi:hypothetical protein
MCAGGVRRCVGERIAEYVRSDSRLRVCSGNAAGRRELRDGEFKWSAPACGHGENAGASLMYFSTSWSKILGPSAAAILQRPGANQVHRSLAHHCYRLNTVGKTDTLQV